MRGEYMNKPNVYSPSFGNPLADMSDEERQKPAFGVDSEHIRRCACGFMIVETMYDYYKIREIRFDSLINECLCPICRTPIKLRSRDYGVE